MSATPPIGSMGLETGVPAPDARRQPRLASIERVARAQRRLWLALLVATLALVGGHVALEYVGLGSLQPVLIAIDAGTAVVALAAATVALRSLARERHRRIIERILLELLATPRSVRSSAAEALRLLEDERIGDAALIACLSDADEPLRVVAVTGFPQSWVEQPLPEGARPVPEHPRATRSRAAPAWLGGTGVAAGKRPWLVEVPLSNGGQPIGLLLIVARRPGPLTDAAVLQLLGAGAGAAIDHASLYEAAYARERDLEERDERRRDFMAAIAHEVRTPLTAIQGFADLLQMSDQELDDTARHLVLSLSQGVARLSSVVNDLIVLGQSGRTGYALREEDVDVGEVVHAAEETLRPALLVRDQRVAFDLPAEGPVASIDRRVLEQVALNLLSNANRHSPPQAAITISARRLDAGTVRLEVTDSGPGIPVPERERVFEPYHLVRRGGTLGSGLGLAVSRRLLEESGGRIWVEDGPDGGARFCVEVSAAEPPLQRAHPRNEG